MKLGDSMRLMEQYLNCPQCGSDRLGNGKGALIIEDEFFYRSCECGFELKMDKDGNLLAL